MQKRDLQPMTAHEHRLVEQARDDLRLRLHRAATERHKREEIVGGEPGWVRYERGVMHRRVDELRERAGLPPVDLAERGR